MPKVEAKDDGKKPRKKRGVKNTGPRVDEMLMEAGDYEVKPDSDFSIDLYLKPQDGRWIICTGPGKGVQKETVTFRMWNYDEMVDLKKKATAYDSSKRMHVVDHDALNQLKAQKLLMSFTFAERNKRIVLHRTQGVMTDESWRKFKKLQPSIIKYIFDKMNEVYEYNG